MAQEKIACSDVLIDTHAPTHVRALVEGTVNCWAVIEKSRGQGDTIIISINFFFCGPCVNISSV